MSDQFDPYYTWLGIPPEEQPPDHYRLLGIRRFEHNHEVISNALGQRQTHIRSYQSGEREVAAKKLLEELAQAGECLASAEKKGAYDRELRQKDAPKLGRATAAPQFSKPAGLHRSSTKVAVTVTQTAAEEVVFSEVPARPTSSPLPWQMLALLAAGGVGIFVLGGIVLAAGLYGAGLFSSKPAKDPLIVQKPPATALQTSGPSEDSSRGAFASGAPIGPVGVKPPPPENSATPTPSVGTFGAPPADPVDKTPDPTPSPEPPPVVAPVTRPSTLEILPAPRTLSDYRGQVNKAYYFAITGNGGGSVYGDNPYTDDSNLETAAVHAGVLPAGKPGVVKVTILQGLPRYRGITRHGVTSWEWQAFGGSFKVEAAPEAVVKTPEAVVKTPEAVVKTPEAVVKTPEPTPTVDPTPTIDPTPTPDPAPKDTRLAVPSDEALQKALELIRGLYKPIGKPTGKQTLAEVEKAKKEQAKDMLKAAETEPDSAVVHVLLTEARRLKLEVGDMDGAFSVVEALVTKFAHNPSRVEAETLQQAFKAANTPTEKKALPEIARRVTQGALADAEFAAARDTAEIAEKLGDANFKKEAHQWLEAANRALEQEAAHVAALQKLLALPDDGEANQACGRFLCLVKRDWQRGLPYLAKANHAGLKEAAAADLAAPSTADAQITLADKWWQLAEQLPAGREKDSLKLRASEWYARALPGATGVKGAQAAARVKEMQDVGDQGPRHAGPAVDVFPDPGYLWNHVRLKEKVFYFDVVGNVSGSIYGTGIYTTDSSLATAAVHSGVLKNGQAGVVKVTILPGRPNYLSTTKNGVTSSGWDAYDSSYKVERGPTTGIRRVSDLGKSGLKKTKEDIKRDDAKRRAASEAAKTKKTK